MADGCGSAGLGAQAANYYVNDGCTEGDVFTTGIGHNAYSGKDPDHPLAGLRPLVATGYDTGL